MSDDARWPALGRLSRVWILIAATGGAVAHCAPESESTDGAPDSGTETSALGLVPTQQAFWNTLNSLCGKAFEGRVTESVPPDASFDGQAMAMHVRQCDEDQIRIPFFVGEDRSRTWVITPADGGLRLKHDHRHEDGSEDAITQYGGDTEQSGTEQLQEFHADAHTGALIPTAARNVWSIEVKAGELFAYALRREGEDRRFRVEFDLGSPIEPPPPPWGN